MTIDIFKTKYHIINIKEHIEIWKGNKKHCGFYIEWKNIEDDNKKSGWYCKIKSGTNEVRLFKSYEGAKKWAIKNL